MIDWVDFEKNLFDFPYFTINNNSKQKIVLFGNCHIAPIGFFLNDLFNKEYNIYIVISWFFEKNGFENFDMLDVKNKIVSLISNCDIFIFQKHVNSYGINANIIHQFVNKSSQIIKIPNLRLTYDVEIEDDYLDSLKLLKQNIIDSDFDEFIFVIENIQNIHFFNTPEHPTHFILFLLSTSIQNKIFYENKMNINPSNEKICINDYFNATMRMNYKTIRSYVILPGRYLITEKIQDITGITIDGYYFD
jgi:hypothetical protein